ncbi:pyridoxal phosphate-dependent aminotransferase [Amycolatopsis benzoatilytica]|uniref:pyridoxal phosphate-dependent aminotransferase n=1 Tax=Amycolatopsis benzoatilytica TaxID=346045 RepID=UPI00036DC8C8|nr:pyridoxal phosphate-dependent aminotransferase [Amycolatopsis benzoatilytica]
MPSVSDQVRAISESATLAVDAKARELAKLGRPVIGFGAGQPDFPTPEHIVEAAAKACRDRGNHGYTAVAGLPDLREALGEKTLRDSGYSVAPDQVLVTNGGKQAVYTAFATLVNPGDEVLLPTPYWTSYPEAIRLAGGIPVEVVADESTGYRVDPAALEAACGPRTKVLAFCSPNNPTGAVYSPGEVAEIGRWAAAKGLWVVTDEIYEHLLYDGAEAVSLPVAVPELAERTLVLNGVAKTYAMTGWRVGWLIGPRRVVAAATKLQSHLCGNVSNVAQRAALAAVSGPLDCVHHMRATFNRRRDLLLDAITAIPGVECPVPRGAFYVYPSVKALLGREIGGTVPKSSAELAELILDRADVAVVPGEAFGTDGYLRMSYAADETSIAEGARRMSDFLGQAG